MSRLIDLDILNTSLGQVRAEIPVKLSDLKGEKRNTATSGTVTLNPNEFTSITPSANVTIALGSFSDSANYICGYHCVVNNSGNKTVTLPSGITWMNGTPTIESGTVIEMHFLRDNSTVYGAWADPSKVGGGSSQTGRAIYSCSCSTAASTAAKVITVDSGQSDFRLETGVIISVIFTATNTAENPTFAVGGTTASSVWYNTAAITTSNLGMAGTLNLPMYYYYDGTYWKWLSWGKDNNTTYSAMSESEMKTGTAPTGRTITAARLRKGCNGYVTEVTGTTATQALQPGVFYSFGEVTSLTVTLATPISGMTNEYKFEFDSGSTATSLSVPNTVKWPETLTVKASTHYEISIKYNPSNSNYYGMFMEWSNN